MFTKEEITKLNEMNKLFNQLEDILLSMNQDTQEKILDYHGASGTLQHCIRWGLQASEELSNEKVQSR